ncbi:DinB family protein [Mucisphaera calidilacus]|nr:DinB family protein [Mucisphaera calidilacus]
MKLPADRQLRCALLAIEPSLHGHAYHGAPTHLGLLKGIKSEESLYRPHDKMNSIREIALHIAYWQNSVANYLSGETIRPGFKQRKTGFAAAVDSITPEQWQQEQSFIRDTQQRLVAIVAAYDPKKLNQRSVAKSQMTAVEMIHDNAMHTIYHTAQLKAARQMMKLGS